MGREPETNQKALLFEIEYPEVEDKCRPRHRFMSAYEQKMDTPDNKFQYLLFACEPYETIAFKVPNMDVDKSERKFYVHCDKTRKVFTMQVFSKRGCSRSCPRCRSDRRPRSSPSTA